MDRSFSNVNFSIKSHHTVLENFACTIWITIDTLVSDNGTLFTIPKFLATNGITVPEEQLGYVGQIFS